jgi:general secretion pathway protein D
LRSSSGSLSYQIGTRNVSTVLRLKDGETQVLAGLISDEARASASKIPGLGDLPVLGRLFSSHSDESQKTEIVLSITPRLVRNLKRPAAEEFWSGTDAAFRTRPLALAPMPESITGKSGAVPLVTVAGEAAAMAPSATTGATAATGATTVAGGSVGASGARFSWDSPAQVKAGQLFRASLRVKAEGSVGSLPFQLGYDPRSLEVVDVREGDFFRQGGVNGNFTSSVDALTGKVTVDTSSPDVAGARGEGTLVNITFKALAPLPKAEIKLLSASGTSFALPEPHVFSISRN